MIDVTNRNSICKLVERQGWNWDATQKGLWALSCQTWFTPNTNSWLGVDSSHSSFYCKPCFMSIMIIKKKIYVSWDLKKEICFWYTASCLEQLEMKAFLSKGRIEASAQLMRQLNLPVRMGLKFSVSGSWECPGSWCPVGFPYYSRHYIAPGLTSLSYYCEPLDDSSSLTWQPHSLKCQAPSSCSVFHLKDTWFHTTRIFYFSELYAVLDMPPYSSGSLRTSSGNIHYCGFWS